MPEQMPVEAVLRWLEQRGRQRNRDGMSRYGIRSAKVFGVSMATMRPLLKRLGRDHDLALALWKSGWLEARVLASFVDEPEKVTPSQMDAWVRAFDNWAVCDSVCMHLFDRTPYAWRKARTWSTRRPEFVKRAAFATIAGLAVHDKTATDAQFIAVLPLIARGSADDRNFVRKAVNWALRQIGKRNLALNAAAIRLARELALADEACTRWIAKGALRELTSPVVRERLERRKSRQGHR